MTDSNMIHRFTEDFNALSRIGALPKGGVTRLAFTPDDLLARTWLMQRMADANLVVTTDAAGNIFGKRPGREELPAVMMGSHIDTVPQGGNYDGAVGVLGALDVLRYFEINQITTRRPVEMVCFAAEESSRFRVSNIGSKALIGALSPEKAATITDQHGCTLAMALERAGYAPSNLGKRPLGPKDLHAFVELHVEQGPVLEAKGCPIGVVTSIAAPTRFKVTVEGRSDHSGSTPMHMRKDALVGVSELILGVERIASREAGKNTVGTSGYAWAMPGSMNVVPGKVEVGIDIRDINAHDKSKAVEAVCGLMEEIAQRRGLAISCQELCDDTPVAMTSRIIDTIEASAKACGHPSIRLHSGAGHDAMNMAKITDTGMIFIPSVGGISHNIAEYTHLHEIEAGLDTLRQTIQTLAGE